MKTMAKTSSRNVNLIILIFYGNLIKYYGYNKQLFKCLNKEIVYMLLYVLTKFEAPYILHNSNYNRIMKYVVNHPRKVNRHLQSEGFIESEREKGKTNIDIDI